MITLTLLEWLEALTVDDDEEEEAGDDASSAALTATTTSLPPPPPSEPSVSVSGEAADLAVADGSSGEGVEQKSIWMSVPHWSTIERFRQRRGLMRDSVAIALICASCLLPMAHVLALTASWRLDLVHATVYLQWLDEAGSVLAVMALAADGAMLGLLLRGGPAAIAALRALRRRQAELGPAALKAVDDEKLIDWRAFYGGHRRLLRLLAIVAGFAWSTTVLAYFFNKDGVPCGADFQGFSCSLNDEDTARVRVSCDLARADGGPVLDGAAAAADTAKPPHLQAPCWRWTQDMLEPFRLERTWRACTNYAFEGPALCLCGKSREVSNSDLQCDRPGERRSVAFFLSHVFDFFLCHDAWTLPILWLVARLLGAGLLASAGTLRTLLWSCQVLVAELAVEVQREGLGPELAALLRAGARERLLRSDRARVLAALLEAAHLVTFALALAAASGGSSLSAQAADTCRMSGVSYVRLRALSIVMLVLGILVFIGKALHTLAVGVARGATVVRAERQAARGICDISSEVLPWDSLADASSTVKAQEQRRLQHAAWTLALQALPLAALAPCLALPFWAEGACSAASGAGLHVVLGLPVVLGLARALWAVWSFSDATGASSFHAAAVVAEGLQLLAVALLLAEPGGWHGACDEGSRLADQRRAIIGVFAAAGCIWMLKLLLLPRSPLAALLRASGRALGGKHGDCGGLRTMDELRGGIALAAQAMPLAVLTYWLAPPLLGGSCRGSVPPWLSALLIFLVAVAPLSVIAAVVQVCINNDLLTLLQHAAARTGLLAAVQEFEVATKRVGSPSPWYRSRSSSRGSSRAWDQVAVRPAGSLRSAAGLEAQDRDETWLPGSLSGLASPSGSSLQEVSPSRRLAGELPLPVEIPLDGVPGGFDFSHAFSMHARIRPSVPWQDGALASRVTTGDSGEPWGFELRLKENKLLVSMAGRESQGQDMALRGTRTIVVDSWQHVAVTYNGSGRASGVKLFVDGSRDPIEILRDNLPLASGSGAEAGAPAPLSVGRRADGSLPFGGRLADLVLFDCVVGPSLDEAAGAAGALGAASPKSAAEMVASLGKANQLSPASTGELPPPPGAGGAAGEDHDRLTPLSCLSLFEQRQMSKLSLDGSEGSDEADGSMSPATAEKVSVGLRLLDPQARPPLTDPRRPFFVLQSPTLSPGNAFGMPDVEDEGGELPPLFEARWRRLGEEDRPQFPLMEEWLDRHRDITRFYVEQLRDRGVHASAAQVRRLVELLARGRSVHEWAAGEGLALGGLDDDAWLADFRSEQWSFFRLEAQREPQRFERLQGEKQPLLSLAKEMDTLELGRMQRERHFAARWTRLCEAERRDLPRFGEWMGGPAPALAEREAFLRTCCDPEPTADQVVELLVHLSEGGTVSSWAEAQGLRLTRWVREPWLEAFREEQMRLFKLEGRRNPEVLKLAQARGGHNLVATFFRELDKHDAAAAGKPCILKQVEWHYSDDMREMVRSVRQAAARSPAEEAHFSARWRRLTVEDRQKFPLFTDWMEQREGVLSYFLEALAPRVSPPPSEPQLRALFAALTQGGSIFSWAEAEGLKLDADFDEPWLEAFRKEHAELLELQASQRPELRGPLAGEKWPALRLVQALDARDAERARQEQLFERRWAQLPEDERRDFPRLEEFVSRRRAVLVRLLELLGRFSQPRPSEEQVFALLVDLSRGGTVSTWAEAQELRLTDWVHDRWLEDFRAEHRALEQLSMQRRPSQRGALGGRRDDRRSLVRMMQSFDENQDAVATLIGKAMPAQLSPVAAPGLQGPRPPPPPIPSVGGPRPPALTVRWRPSLVSLSEGDGSRRPSLVAGSPASARDAAAAAPALGLPPSPP